jgi:hypothetical protein
MYFRHVHVSLHTCTWLDVRSVLVRVPLPRLVFFQLSRLDLRVDLPFMLLVLTRVHVVPQDSGLRRLYVNPLAGSNDLEWASQTWWTNGEHELKSNEFFFALSIKFSRILILFENFSNIFSHYPLRHSAVLGNQWLKLLLEKGYIHTLRTLNQLT